MHISRPIAALLVAATLSTAAARADEPSGLTAAEFQKLHRELQAPREPWQSVPWKLSLLEAQDQAVKERKPVYLLCRSGHPLACVCNNGIADRASAFQDAEVVRLISTRFVPVAVDQHIHRSLKGEEGELFARVLKQASRGLGGYSQGVYLFAPDGKLLGFANTADAAHVKRLLHAALKKFDPDGAGPHVGGKGKRIAPFPEAPQGGLVIAVTTKVLAGYEGAAAERYGNSLGRDHLWLRKDEAEALGRGVLPDSVTRRLARFHLVDNTRGEPPMWRNDEVQEMRLTLRDGRLSGSVRLATKAGDRGYQAELFGQVETKDGKVVRFDLVARGQFWGEGSFTRGAPKGRFPLAVAFTLTDTRDAASRVPPQAARGSARGYLR